MMLQLPHVIGHRGACHYAPENTLASLRKAKALGVTWVEFDAKLTADGEAIVIHDETLERTTNGHGLVAEITYAQIATLDAGSWFAPEFAGEKVPTLIEYLACAAELGLSINVEIKPTPGTDEETARKVVDILHAYWPTYDRLLVSSFSLPSLIVHALDQRLNLALLMREWLPNWQTLLADINGIALHIRHNLVTPERVQAIKSVVPYVMVYTVNDSQLAQTLFAMGVDAVFSDAPDLISRHPGASIGRPRRS